MPTPGQHIQTVHNPARYTRQQIENAVTIAHALHRGQFVLTEAPKR